MSDDAFWSAIFIGAMLLMMGAGAIYTIYGICCRSEPTGEQVWVAQQARRCDAMRSRLSYDAKLRAAECWRTPFMRKPILMFKDRYEGEK